MQVKTYLFTSEEVHERWDYQNLTDTPRPTLLGRALPNNVTHEPDSIALIKELYQVRVPTRK